jgi:hypothetical protein
MQLDKVLLTIFKFFSLISGVALGYFVFELSSFWSNLKEALESVVFQSALVLLVLYATSSSSSTFISAFLLAALVRSFYMQYRDKNRGDLKKWFKGLNVQITQSFVTIYFILIGLLFLYSLLNFVF